MRVYKNKANNQVVPIIQGQAVTPAQMDQLRKKGQSISAFQLSADNFFDGDVNPQFDIPIEQQRHVDVATIWEEQMSARGKISDFEKEEKRKQQLEKQKSEDNE